MPRSAHGGRHELGQNFLVHRPSIDTVIALATAADGPILEIGAGDGALTRRLAMLHRPLTAIDLDEHRVRRLAAALPRVEVIQADALAYPLRARSIVGNVPFHLTTAILRRLLTEPGWTTAVLVTQWEVARKRAGVGGHTLLTAQHGPWFAFDLHGRIPRWGFRPAPSVDGGILAISRRGSPLVAAADRRAYQHFVRDVFSAGGGTLDRVVARGARVGRSEAQRALREVAVASRALPRDLTPSDWAGIWRVLRKRGR